MHKLQSIIVAGCLSGSLLLGDAVDDGLGAAPEPLKAQARSMIRAGMPAGDAVGMIRAMQEHQFKAEEIMRAQ